LATSSQSPDPRRAWNLGNTTVRSPVRIRNGLIALSGSLLEGDLEGRPREQAFARLLDVAGVAKVLRLREGEEIAEEVDASDLGRKWRSSMTQLGFITPRQDVLAAVDSDRLPFTITEAGQRLIAAETVVGQQECFLRALLAHQIPSPIEPFPEPVFCPLRIVLEILGGLARAGLDAHIHKDEMAVIVQLVRRVEDMPDAVQQIADYRAALGAQTTGADKKRFRRKYREGARTQTQSGNTLKDYADSNFRYLKATGLFVDRGSRIEVAEYQRTTVRQILAVPYAPIPLHDYPEFLWHGAALPTDRPAEATEAIRSLVDLLQDAGETVEVPDLASLNIRDLSQVRLALRDDYTRVLEAQYADRQVREIADILDYLRALTQRRNQLIPSDEAPAYLEWALWRAFLAIDSLLNPAWKARRFQIDPTDFTPVGTAPGGGPDMIFEFDDCVIVGEVTLTVSSRQEAAEGEPVRRHVGDLALQYQKPVYGLFIANVIDTNTAETFRRGTWFTKADDLLDLRIVPLTLAQFIDLFAVLFGRDGRAPSRIVRAILDDCIARKHDDARVWKLNIAQSVASHVGRLGRDTA